MAHIVIMGAGIGGLPAAYEMRDMLPKEHRVTVVNALDYFQFVPSNPWIAVGWRKREDIVVPIAPLLDKKGIDFIARPVIGIDPANNRLTVEGDRVVDEHGVNFMATICAICKAQFTKVLPAYGFDMNMVGGVHQLVSRAIRL